MSGPVPPPPPPNFRPNPGQQQQQRPQGPPGFMPMRHPIQQSSHLQDITPHRILDDAACLKILTTYAAWTIRKEAPRDSKDKATWARADCTQEKFSKEDIIKQIKKLDKESKRTVADKKAALATFQQGQITKLLDDLGSKEFDPAFEWSLVQIDPKIKPINTVRAANKKSLYETVTMSVFVKRAPLPDQNPIQLYQAQERAKADRQHQLHMQQQQQQMQQQMQMQQQQQHQQQQNQQQQQPRPQGANQQQGRAPPPPPGVIQLPKNGPQGGNPRQPQGMKQHQQRGGKNRPPTKYHQRDHSSSDSSSYGSSDSSGSDSGSSDEDSFGTSISSKSKSRRRSKGPNRKHSFHRESRAKYYLEPRSVSPRRHRASDDFGGLPSQHRPYAPDVPRGVAGVDPITSAYQAGKQDAIAERFGDNRYAQQPQQIIRPVIERIIDPRPIVSYGCMEPQFVDRPRRIEPQFVDRPRRIEPRFFEDSHDDDLRSVEDDLIIRRRRAEEYIDRQDIDRRPIELDRRPEPRPFLERRNSAFDRRPHERPELFERRYTDARPLEHIGARQEFFDRGPRDMSPRRSGRDSHPFASVPLPRRYPPSSVTSDGW